MHEMVSDRSSRSQDWIDPSNLSMRTFGSRKCTTDTTTLNNIHLQQTPGIKSILYLDMLPYVQYRSVSDSSSHDNTYEFIYMDAALIEIVLKVD